MRDAGVAHPPGLREYIGVIRARKATIGVVFALVLGSALLFSWRQSPVYYAAAHVLVQPLPVDTSDYAPPPNLDTEAQIVSSNPVTDRVIADLGLSRSPGAMTDGLEVETVTETEVLVVGYSSQDGELAQDAANSFASNYIDYRRERALEILVGAQESIQQQVDAAQRELGRIEKDLEEARASGDDSLVSTLEGQRGVVLAKLGVLEQRVQDIQPQRSMAQSGSEIIKPAGLPSAPASPDHLRNGLLGGALGLLLGIAAAFLRERLDDRFRDRLGVEQALGAPVLATVPRFPTPSKGQAPGVVVVSDPRGPASESYRTLRTGLDFIVSRRQTRSILVTSPTAAEGKTVTTVNLGMVAADAGARVALVSADLRRPSLERYLGVPNQSGVSTWLAGFSASPDGLIQVTTSPNMSVVASGPLPPNPAELLASPRLAELVALLERRFDLVLFDSPPVLPVADAMILGSRVGAALLVVNAATTRRSAATHAKEELQRVGADVIGAVLNEFDPSTSPYQYEHYSYAAYGPSPETLRSNGGPPPGARAGDPTARGR
jgi:succinoglycan biosynthesis transport protein ExoP